MFPSRTANWSGAPRLARPLAAAGVPLEEGLTWHQQCPALLVAVVALVAPNPGKPRALA